MKILAIAQVEDRKNLDKQILKQTIQPERTIFYIDENPAKTIEDRRKRIAENHNKLKSIVESYQPDLVWQLEQDVELPENCLERLLGHFIKLDNKNFGYISGVQVGRHGLYCLGAWVNFKEDSFESINHRLRGLQKVEATGFYCLLAPTSVWLSGRAEWNDEPYGPDVVWSKSINKDKYVDMGLKIGHIVKKGIIHPDHMSTTTVRFYLDKDNKWRYKCDI